MFSFHDFHFFSVAYSIWVVLKCVFFFNPGIRTILHWLPPNLLNFDTDPSLVGIQQAGNTIPFHEAV